MYKLLSGDFYKLRHSTGFHVMMVLSVVFGIIDSIESNMAGYDAFYAHFGDLRTLMFVFVGVFSGVFIGEDFVCRTFQGEVASGNARSKVLLSKTLLYLLGICIMIMIQILIVVVARTPLVLSLASSLPNLLPSELVLSIIIAFTTMIGLFLVANLHFRKCELK